MGKSAKKIRKAIESLVPCPECGNVCPHVKRHRKRPETCDLCPDCHPEG